MAMPASAAHDPHDPNIIGVLEADYLAGTVHWHVLGQHHAVGVTDCVDPLPSLATIGGACFDLSQFPDNAGLFLEASDDVALTDVSLFAGFDDDGDGCVGCVPGQDTAWEGINSLGGAIPVGNPGTLVVFVRALDLESGGPHLGTVGHLTLTIFDEGTGPCQEDPVGTQQEHEPTDDPCGTPFQSPLPYAYPCTPACEGS